MFSKMLLREESSVQMQLQEWSLAVLCTSLPAHREERKTHMEMRLHSFLLFQLKSSLYAWPVHFPNK